MGTTLRYPYELRATKDYFGDIPDVKIPGEMLKLAEHILETKKGDFKPSAFVDHYEERFSPSGLGFPRPSEATPTKCFVPLCSRSFGTDLRNTVKEFGHPSGRLQRRFTPTAARDREVAANHQGYRNQDTMSDSG